MSAPLVTPRKSYAFMVWRKSGGRPPRFRHETLASAVTEAERLAAERPGGTFVVLQELCRVSLAADASPSAEAVNE